MHPTACACERNWSAWGQLYIKLRSRMAVERARRLVCIRGNGRQKGEEQGELEVCLNLMVEGEAVPEEAGGQQEARGRGGSRGG